MNDPIINFITSSFELFLGKPGDVFIIFCLILMVYLIWRKLYKMSAGFFVLALGTVILRVFVGILFI